MEKIRFELIWHIDEDRTGDVPNPTLAVLTDNSINVIPSQFPEESGIVAVAVTYYAARSEAHTISWTLMFPGQKLKDLHSYATVNNGTRRDLNKSSSSENKWSSQGVAWQ